MGTRTRVLYPELRFLLRTGASLASVLGVSPQAVSKASGIGRIGPRPDGWWDLFDVLAEWRSRTRWSLQRPTMGLPPWLDLALPITQGMVDELVRRARAADAYELDPNAAPDAAEEANSGQVAFLSDRLALAVADAFAGYDVEKLRAVLAQTLTVELPPIVESHAGHG